MSPTPAFATFNEALREQDAFASVVYDSFISHYNRRLKRKTTRIRATTRLKDRKLSLATRLAVEWQVVMLVTTMEAYLLDALAYAAACDPSMMKDTKQAATYEEIAASVSVQDLTATLRHRWARNFVDSGGPKKIADRLTRMGAIGYEKDSLARLEFLWGQRHVIVHNGGRATQDFCRRYPAAAAKLGERIKIKAEYLLEATKDVTAFVSRTEEFLVRRCASTGT